MIRRWDPADAERIADIFREHDRTTTLPADLGVTRRTLYGFHDLYFHLVEGADDFRERLYAAIKDQRFRSIDDQLATMLTPYVTGAPSMAQARAIPFYEWSAEG